MTQRNLHSPQPESSRFQDADPADRHDAADFFHGCRTPEDASLILKEGLRLKHFVEEEGECFDPGLTGNKTQRRIPPKFLLGGALGSGVYVTRDYELARMYGSSVFRLRPVAGTRIVLLGGPADMKVISQLKREFGKDILRPRTSLHKTLPRNKQLTRAELIELTRYHFFREYEHRYEERATVHVSAVRECIHLMRRYQIDAVGHPGDINGIVVFHPWKFIIIELVNRDSKG